MEQKRSSGSPDEDTSLLGVFYSTLWSPSMECLMNIEEYTERTRKELERMGKERDGLNTIKRRMIEYLGYVMRNFKYVNRLIIQEK